MLRPGLSFYKDGRVNASIDDRHTRRKWDLLHSDTRSVYITFTCQISSFMQPSPSIFPNLHTPPTLLQGCPCAISATKPEKPLGYYIAQDNRHTKSSICRCLHKHCSFSPELNSLPCSNCAFCIYLLDRMRVCRRCLLGLEMTASIPHFV